MTDLTSTYERIKPSLKELEPTYRLIHGQEEDNYEAKVEGEGGNSVELTTADRYETYDLIGANIEEHANWAERGDALLDISARNQQGTLLLQLGEWRIYKILRRALSKRHHPPLGFGREEIVKAGNYYQALEQARASEETPAPWLDEVGT